MIDFKNLLKSGVHFGHKTSFGHPKMRPYIWGAKNRIHLIDVSKTAVLLAHAGKKLTEIASNGGSVLLVGTKKAARKIIEKAGADLNMPFVINRWIGGTLSNYGQVKKAVTRLLHLRDVLEKSTGYYTKKELVMLQKQVDRLERNVGGIIDLAFPPSAIVVVDAKKEFSAVKEAFGMNIPVISLVDTNTDPSLVTNIIPCNDDSPKSIACIVEYLTNCFDEGKKLAKAKKAEAIAAKAKENDKKKTEAKKSEPKAVVKKVVAKKAEPKATEKKIVAKKTVEKKAEPKKAEPKAVEKKEIKTVEKKPAAKKTVAKKTVKKAEPKK